MTKTEEAIKDLLGLSDVVNQNLCIAYERGLVDGEELERKSIQRNTEVVTTARMLRTIMRVQKISLEDAMVLFQIPRQDRKTFRGIFGKR